MKQVGAVGCNESQSQHFGQLEASITLTVLSMNLGVPKSRETLIQLGSVDVHFNLMTVAARDMNAL